MIRAILGKPGFLVLKEEIAKIFKPLASPNQVSLARYRIGLILFFGPILLAHVAPYIAGFFPAIVDLPVGYYVASDVIFFSSFFVLGGDFWDKIAGLFKHKEKISESPQTNCGDRK